MTAFISKILLSFLILTTLGCNGFKNKEIIYYADTDNVSYVIQDNGITEKYYENGQIAYKAKYNDQQLINLYYVYDENGNRIDSWEWSIDSVNVCKFRPDGSKKSCGYYINGYKEGYWEVYTRKGKKYDSVYYENGYDTTLSMKNRMNYY